MCTVRVLYDTDPPEASFPPPNQKSKMAGEAIRARDSAWPESLPVGVCAERERERK
jgi:hypothetical protein